MAKKAKSAKKPKAKSKAPPKTARAAIAADAGGGTKAIRMVSGKDVNDLLDKCLRRQEEASTASGQIGKLVAAAVDDKGLHSGAFGLIRRLVRMGNKDPSKLWMLLAHFDDMRDKVDLDKLAGKQEQMFGAGVEGDEDEQPQLAVEGSGRKPRRQGPAIAGTAARVADIAQAAGASPAGE